MKKTNKVQSLYETRLELSRATGSKLTAKQFTEELIVQLDTEQYINMCLKCEIIKLQDKLNTIYGAVSVTLDGETQSDE